MGHLALHPPSRPPGPPEKALIDWIFLRTATSDWHGDQPAALWANRSQLYAYNSPEILKQVDDIVERFINAVEDMLSVRVQIVAAVDPRWRYTVYSRLTYVGGGPQGQQIWTMRMDDAALVLSQMQVQQGFRPLARGRLEMINGQTVRWKTLEERTLRRRAPSRQLRRDLLPAASREAQ